MPAADPPVTPAERLARGLARLEAATKAAQVREERLEAAARSVIGRIDRLLAEPEDEAEDG